MTRRFNTVRVKANWDQTLTDSDNIEGFTPNTGSPLQVDSPVGNVYIFVDGLPEFNRGAPIYDASAGTTYIGMQTVTYTTPQMHMDTYAWLETNYEGQVTAYLRTNSTTYARYNCQLRFQYSPSDRRTFFTVKWIFTIIEAL